MLTGLELVQQVHSGQRSARAIAADTMAQIEAQEPALNAFTDRTFARALREADAIDLRRSRGEPLPPLAGLPYAVKNLFDIEGVVTRAGAALNRAQLPAHSDAVLVQRMRAAGAILLGAQNMDEYAYGFTTENSHTGDTHNPHDVSRTAGGSSGGSAAAVAAGQVAVALGSDTNGSIRVPASLCGIWGLKPTFGRLSRRGSYPFVHSLDHLGPFARSVNDLAAVYNALQGPDPADPACCATTVQPVAGQDEGVEHLRIAVLGGYFAEHAQPIAQAALTSAASALNVTAQVEWPLAALARAAAFITTAAEGGTLHLPQLQQYADAYGPLTGDRMLAGAMQPAAWALRAQRFRRVYREYVERLFQHWDVLLAPATPCAATPLGQDMLMVNGQEQPLRPALGLLTQPISFAGCPVIAAPFWPGGPLPVGVQIIAAPWREDLVFRVARQLEGSGVAVVRSPAALPQAAGLL